MEKEMERFVRGPKVDEVTRGTGRLFFVDGVPVAVLNAGGAFYAVEDACPFDGARLSDGFIAGSVIECRGDNAEFFLPTGECLSQPEGKDLRTFRVRLDERDVYIDLGHASAPEESEDEIGSLEAAVDTRGDIAVTPGVKPAGLQ
jgi:3-phenylpropionate/trans-cinnamate dioxygenase ferredoxin subunit